MRTSTKQMDLKYYNMNIIITILDQVNINFVYLCAAKSLPLLVFTFKN